MNSRIFLFLNVLEIYLNYVKIEFRTEEIKVYDFSILLICKQIFHIKEQAAQSFAYFPILSSLPKIKSLFPFKFLP